MQNSMDFCLDALREIYGNTDRVLDLSELSEFELTVVLVTRVLGIGVNMGLSEMLKEEIDGDPDYRNSIGAFEKIGATDVAKIMAELLSLADTESNEAVSNRKEELDREFFGLEGSCFDRLASFIKDSNQA